MWGFVLVSPALKWLKWSKKWSKRQELPVTGPRPEHRSPFAQMDPSFIAFTWTFSPWIFTQFYPTKCFPFGRENEVWSPACKMYSHLFWSQACYSCCRESLLLGWPSLPSLGPCVISDNASGCAKAMLVCRGLFSLYEPPPLFWHPRVFSSFNKQTETKFQRYLLPAVTMSGEVWVLCFIHQAHR